MKASVLWVGALAIAAVMVVATDYHSRDPDSALYAKLAAELARQPVSRWIAPEWNGEWGLHGLFREHPVGILLLPTLAIRLGFPAEQASYVVNMLYQVGVILLIPAVAAFVVRGMEARTLAWSLQLLPVAFAYRIRANQEHPVLMAFLALLYGTQRARTQPLWVLLMMAAFASIVLIKGAFAMFALAAAVLWLIVIPRASDGSDRWAWLGLAVTLATTAVLVVVYEAAYDHTTGESFLEFYRSKRLGQSISLTGAGVIWHSLRNAAFYVIRILWFAAPWSLFAVAAAWVWARSKVQGSTPATFVEMTSRALCWSLLITAVQIAVLSPALVRAERFIFPTYFIIGAVGVVTAIRNLEGIRSVAARADAYAWLPAGLWLVTFLLSLGSRLSK